MAAIVAGSVISVIAAALLPAGGVGLWADSARRGSDGWLTSSWHGLQTPTRALTAES